MLKYQVNLSDFSPPQVCSLTAAQDYCSDNELFPITHCGYDFFDIAIPIYFVVEFQSVKTSSVIMFEVTDTVVAYRYIHNAHAV